jgi:predicted TIM-barrel fold metal-dependent hydrolase
MSNDAFTCAKGVLGMDHILLGSDYPFEKPDEMMGSLEGLDLSEDEKQLLYHGNAANHLGIVI